MNFDPVPEDLPIHSFIISSTSQAKITSWNVVPGDKIRKGGVLLSFNVNDTNDQSDSNSQLKSSIVGVVRETAYSVGDTVPPGSPVVWVEDKCDHSVVVFDLCTDCGRNLRQGVGVKRPRPGGPTSDRISMVHGVPEIQISRQEAEVLGNKDKLRLLTNRKLALIIDLDQTLIHTSVDCNIEPGLPDVYNFCLPGNSLLYHCRLRPHARQFLKDVSQYYETHVFTMGTKQYAACVTNILDPDKKLFYGRIISRDDCFDPHSKALRLKSVFPCGDAMVAIIDDREDVWGRCANLIHVKPYIFFAGTSDINAPPGSHPSQPHKKHTTPSTPSHATPPHTTSTAMPVPPQNTPSNEKTVEKTLSPDSTKNAPTAADHNIPTPATMEAESSSSSNSDSDSEDSSSSTSSSVDDTVFDVLDSQNEPSINEPAPPDNETPPPGNKSAPSSNEPAPSINETPPGNKSAPSINETAPSNNETAPSSNETAPSSDEPAHLGNESAPSNNETALSINETAPPDNETATLENHPTPSDEAMSTAVPTVAVPTATITKESDKNEFKEVPSKGAPEEMDTQKPPEEMDTQKPPEEMDTQKPPEAIPATPTNKTREIKDPDKFLLYLTHTLKQVHKVFYAEYDAMSNTSSNLTTPDVKEIIPKIRHSVLKGTKILFTGVIPTNMPCEKSPEWNTARAFGASIHDRFVYGLSSSNPQKAMRATTHVIVGRPGTSKLREARRISGIKIVTPKWLWRCAEQWELVDEREFPVKFDEEEQGKEAKSTTKIPIIPPKKQRIEPPRKQTSRRNEYSTKQSISMNTPAQSRIMERHMSIDSVSDEELERMNAEVDAEIESSSTSTSGDEQNTELGTLIQPMDQDDDDNEETYDKFAGLSGKNGRKRKHEDVSSSSDNSPRSIGLLDESVDLSENSGSDDELANLLGT